MPNTTLANYQTEEFAYDYLDASGFSTILPPHIHNGWEFLYVKNGELSYSVDGSTFDISPGSLIITPPGAVHTLHPKGVIRYERHDLIITENLLIKDLIGKLPPDLRVLDISGSSILMSLFERFGFYITHLSPDHLEVVLRALVSELWASIYISTQISSPSVEATSNTVITKAIEFIKDHIQEPITVEQISNALFITPRYLYQCFAKYLNVTPRHYIMLQKLQLVQHKLANAENPTKVCREYGFRNYSTFYRNYQKIYGCRPSDGPKQSLQKIELHHKI